MTMRTYQRMKTVVLLTRPRHLWPPMKLEHRLYRISSQIKSGIHAKKRVDLLIQAIPADITAAHGLSASDVAQLDNKQSKQEYDNASSICGPIVRENPSLGDLIKRTFRAMQTRMSGTTIDWCGSNTARCASRPTCVLHHALAHLATKRNDYPSGFMIYDDAKSNISSAQSQRSDTVELLMFQSQKTLADLNESVTQSEVGQQQEQEGTDAIDDGIDEVTDKFFTGQEKAARFDLMAGGFGTG